MRVMDSVVPGNNACLNVKETRRSLLCNNSPSTKSLLRGAIPWLQLYLSE